MLADMAETVTVLLPAKELSVITIQDLPLTSTFPAHRLFASLS
jgi:hypothetical protein